MEARDKSLVLRRVIQSLSLLVVGGEDMAILIQCRVSEVGIWRHRTVREKPVET